MGTILSCSTPRRNSITTYPAAPPLPQQQRSQRQRLHLEYSAPHGEDVPRYRRQKPPQPQRRALPLRYSDDESARGLGDAPPRYESFGFERGVGA
ncbi:hypothetical protein IMSHALPRED_003396 [Imshaugia aleurites]|uniref:Uncharacterized protein n=1 Tax=Imshaugia aleurites TaxID=172621 RepID=A0A8H3PJZ4_9LECA|nr:hypothetical protein IMSHALPRED_003396 [Imshaugia aleurites]